MSGEPNSSSSNLWWKVGRRISRRFPALRPLGLKFISTISIIGMRRRRSGQTFAVDRPTVVVCVHQATRTGAPIIALSLVEHLSKSMNVICVLLQGGELLESFVDGAIETISPLVGTLQFGSASVFAMTVLRPIMIRYSVDTVLVASAEAAVATQAAVRMGLPNVCLVHEFAQNVLPQDADRLRNADLLVFSSHIQRQSFVRSDTSLLSNSFVMAQGKCFVPERPTAHVDATALDAEIERKGREQTFLCIGCGHVQPRKGVDLFIAAAAKLRKRGVPAQFLWVGDGFRPSLDPVSLWLKDQIERSDLQGVVSMIPAVGGTALHRLYVEADAMFLSSRLDPMPNVAIDAIHAGLPVVCFDKASGVAEIFGADDLLKTLVVPYYDVEAAAEVLAKLAGDVNLREKLRTRLHTLAKEHFDMAQYVSEIERLLRVTTKVTGDIKWPVTR